MLLWLLACAPEATEDAGAADDPMSWSALEDGPLNVGYRLVEQTYTDPAGEAVTIPVNVWFPTEDTSGPSPMYYTQEDPDSIEGAAPMAPVHSGGHPVMVFSHGSFLYGGSGAYLARRFASHGWVVTAPDHIDNVLPDALSTVPLSVHYRRPLSDSAAVDALSAQADLDVAADAVVMVGYSFGGWDGWLLGGATLEPSAFDAVCQSGGLADCTEDAYAALAADLQDTRVVGFASLAGAERLDYFTDGSLSGLSVPVLMMSGTEDSDDPQRQWDLSDGTETTWVSVDGGCHAMFGNGGCANIDTEVGHDLTSAYVFAFARRVLQGDDSAAVTGLLSGAEQPWPEATLQVR